MDKKTFETVSVLFFIVIIAIGGIGYLIYQNYQFKNQNSSLKDELFLLGADFISTKQELNDNINSLAEQLSQTEVERNDFEQKYTDEKRKMDFLAMQISGIAGAVEYLEKLNETDSELLMKYSKVYFLNENYAPESLDKINSEYTYNIQAEYLFNSKILPFLNDMLLAAKNDGVNLKITSAYRSFGLQAQIKQNHITIYGSGANKFSADQGYSEHQLGTTVDFMTPEINTLYDNFETTKAYQWLLNNAYKYGFIISYPEDNEYYQFESWHWRFVSRGLATELHKTEKNFYDLDQRQINQYLAFFFD